MNLPQLSKARRATAGALFAAGIATTGLILWSETAMAAATGGGYADLVEKVEPAVVYIEVSEPPQPAVSGNRRVPRPSIPGSPFEEFFKRFGVPVPQAPEQGERKGVGSGFIVDGDGHIVTNNHVVDGAREVMVRLTDGRSYSADVVGTDPVTDLALLKVRTDADLPAVGFGDSDIVRPGDAVIAIGNPFGLGGTVTSGIVSATSRNINAGPYDDFIQTDAAINKGNSGGPLFNTDGEVIGVNTAIFSPSGGSIGIGFAVPSNMARSVIAQIKEKGHVERGWLGVKVQRVTPELAEGLGLDKPAGALIAEVTPDGPAAAAGLGQGDVIVSFAGKTVDEMRDLPRMVAAVSPGRDIAIEALRKGRTIQASVRIGELDPTRMATAESPRSGKLHSDRLGADLAVLDDAARSRLDLGKDAAGVVVTSVDPKGASASRLVPGDVIEEVDGTPVALPAEIERALSEQRTRSTAILRVNRDGSDLYVGIRPKVA